MFKKTYYVFGAAMTTGLLMGVNPASAQDAPVASSGSSAAGNNFSNIASNITTSLSDLPGLVTALSYLFGLLIGVLGIMKIKDHVENPTQTPLKDGAIRLAAGGALFALPIVFEAMSSTIGEGTTVNVSKMNRVSLGVNKTP